MVEKKIRFVSLNSLYGLKAEQDRRTYTVSLKLMGTTNRLIEKNNLLNTLRHSSMISALVSFIRQNKHGVIRMFYASETR